MKTLISIIEANYDEVVVTKLGNRQYLCESIAEDLENLGIHNSTFSYCKRVKEGDHFKQHGTCTIEIYENFGITQSLFGKYSFKLASINIPKQ